MEGEPSQSALVDKSNISAKTVPGIKQPDVGDSGYEDCQVISVNLKRKRKLKPESFEVDPNQTKLESNESNDSSQVEEDASIIKMSNNFKTEVQKSDDVQTELKCDHIKREIINLDHNYASSAINCKSDVKIRSFGYFKSEPVSTDTVDSESSEYCASDEVEREPSKSIECNSNAVICITSDSKAPEGITLCHTLSEESELPFLDGKKSIAGDQKPNSSPFLYDACENVSLDYESLLCHKREKQSLVVNIGKEKVCNYQEDVSDCETISESNVLSIEPIVEEETLALDVGNPVRDVGSPVLDVVNPVLDVGNPVLDVGSPVLDVRNNVHDVENTVLEVGNTVLDVESTVHDVENTVLDVRHTVCDGRNNVLDVGSPVFDVRHTVCDVGSPVHDAGNNVLRVESPTIFPLPKSNVASIEPVRKNEIPTMKQITGLLSHCSDAKAVYTYDDFLNSQKAVDSQKINNPQRRFGDFYKCGTCAGLFKTLEDFMDHENGLSRCNSSSRRLTKIVMSSDALSARKGVNVCECCKKCFTDALELDDHYSKHYAGGVCFSCVVCGKRFAVHSHLMHHKRVRGHGSLMHVCKICRESFQNALLIENHLKTAHKQMDVNDMEQYIDRVPVMIVDDQNKGNETKVASNMESLMESRKDKVSLSSKPKYIQVSSKKSAPFIDLKLHTCDVCQQGFHHGENLLKHFEMHATGKAQICMICEEKFDDIESLRSHMSVHQWSIYSQKYRMPLKVSKHIKIHDGSNFPYVCSLCGMNFDSLQKARGHLPVHGEASIFMYACDVCGEEKTTKWACKRRCGMPKPAERNMSNWTDQSRTMSNERDLSRTMSNRRDQSRTILIYT